MCLPIEKANDGKIDCLGATDEPSICRRNLYVNYDGNFYCKNDSRIDRFCIVRRDICSNYMHCDHEDYQEICAQNANLTNSRDICNKNNAPILSNVLKFLCGRTMTSEKERRVNFSLGGVRNSMRHTTKRDKITMLPRSSTIRTVRERQQRCHRGIDLQVWLGSEKNLTTSTCLCPPSFYGSMCQYQNQRVSLTMRFRTLSDVWRTPFALVVSLIDDGNEGTIHSYHQFTYLPIRDCQIKYNFYLLYSTRPKDHTKNYSVHIDIYEKMSLAYRGSWLVPVTFPFLPVHRLIIQPIIPRSGSVATCFDPACINGKCVPYSNDPNETTFCQCYGGWSGRYCTIPHTSICAFGSVFAGVSANNRSLCVCPIHKFGSQCLLDNTACQLDQNDTCYNGGQCIPVDEYVISHRKFTCICQQGFTGDRCEIRDTKITISFQKDIVLPQSMLLHFIEVINGGPPKRATSFKVIPVNQNSAIVYWSDPFHVVFVELPQKNYYLAVVQEAYHPSTAIDRTLNPSDRCKNISEVLNETIVNLHLLRRIKHYHVPCETHSSQLSCFYDDIHLCLCVNHGQQREANCFEFNHQLTFDCFGQSGCDNGAECFRDSSTCARTSMCKCRACFYGRRCQFSTSEFSLSLDVILGYHILPHVSIAHQPPAVKMSVALTIVISVAGLLDGVLSVITFKNKNLRQVGCGFYLLGSSITTILTVTVFALKFWILVAVQMALIVNQSFLHIQCVSIDFLLRICLSMDQWLNACVAIERAITIMKGASFDQKKSIQVAKLMIPALLLLTIGTAIHDPVYRRLTDEDDGDEKRIWCITNYSSSLQIFNSGVQIFHVFVPFCINVISALIIIMKNARQRSTVRTQQSYTQHVREQFQQHTNLLIAPCVLVTLAFPRLIISFVSGCMQSARDSWLFLAGYFISFIPSILTFVLFVLPSTLYKKEFYKSVEQYRKTILNRLRLFS
jgi:hypothetical protein